MLTPVEPMDPLIELLSPNSSLPPTTPIPWEPLFKRAKAHEVFPLFYEVIRKHPSLNNTVPTPLKEEMNALYYKHTARNILLLNHVKTIMRTFGDSHISFLLFKGFDLSLRLYGNIFARTQRDLDFIVESRDLSQAKRLLEQIGFKAVEKEGNNFSDGRLIVELHRDIIHLNRFEQWEEPPLAIKGFWERHQTISLEEMEISVLALEDLFLALAVHFGFHHHFRGLKWLIDFAWLASHPKLDWLLLKERARENHLEIILDEVFTRLEIKKCKTVSVPLLTRFDVKLFRYLLRLKLLPKWGQRWRMIWETKPILEGIHWVRDPAKYNRLEVAIEKWIDKYKGIETWEDRCPTPTRYRLLRRVFKSLPVNNQDVFIDFGSGKGRALLMAARFPFKRIIGVEILERLNRIASKNIDHMKNQLRCRAISIVTQDIQTFNLPKDVTVGFLFEPFALDVFPKLLENIKNSLELQPRPFTLIVYADRPFHLALEKYPWLKKTKEYKLARLDPCIIYESTP